MRCTRSPFIELGTPGAYIHRAKKGLGNLRCASPSLRQDRVMFSCNYLENSSGCFLITSPYATYTTVGCNTLHSMTLYLFSKIVQEIRVHHT